MSTSYTVEERREIMRAANARGLVVKGRDGSSVKAVVCGANNDFPNVHIKLPFGDVSIEYGWGTIVRATKGNGELQA
jgi:hypothetical protein